MSSHGTSRQALMPTPTKAPMPRMPTTSSASPSRTTVRPPRELAIRAANGLARNVPVASASSTTPVCSAE